MRLVPDEEVHTKVSFNSLGHSKDYQAYYYSHAGAKRGDDMTIVMRLVVCAAA